MRRDESKLVPTNLYSNQNVRFARRRQFSDKILKNWIYFYFFILALWEHFYDGINILKETESEVNIVFGHDGGGGVGVGEGF